MLLELRPLALFRKRLEEEEEEEVWMRTSPS